MPNDDKNGDIIIELVGQTRQTINEAKRKVVGAQRPLNACSVHDDHIALGVATATGIDTLLAIQERRLDRNPDDCGSFRAACIKNIKFLAIVAACALCFLTAIGKFDFQQAVTEWIQRHADNRSAYQYEASDSKN